MSESTQLIADTTVRIFREFGNPQDLLANGERRAALWSALQDAGLTLAWVDESRGGSGASLADGFDVLRIAGEFAVNVPLAETLLAGWVLSKAGLDVPSGVLTLAPVNNRDRILFDREGRLRGRARRVPYASEAQYIVFIGGGAEGFRVALAERSRCGVEQGKTSVGDALDEVVLDSIEPGVTGDRSIRFDDVLVMGAVVRAVQMAGAMQSILHLSVAYANERVAFEKPIGKFQSIQHSLARLAAEAAAALAVAGSAADAIASGLDFDDAVFFEAASAKIRVGEAAAVATAIAHQVHGAIGFSKEHVLHTFTQRILGWRNDFGDESFWALWLGRQVAAKGVDELWPMLASR